VERGFDYCSARGCKEQSGLACSYVDRRDRACPTAWCPEHRVLTHGAIYCPAHATLVNGTSTIFGMAASPDVGNRVPLLVNWVTRELDADLHTLAQRVALNFDEHVVVEPVRFVLVGVQRIRTWERSWKTCSHFGVDLRMAVAVEERRPDVVLAKVNSNVVLALRPPWSEDYPVGPEPESESAAQAAIARFCRRVVFALGSAADDWFQEENDRRLLSAELSGERSGEAVQERYRVRR
jgi:hypothetical protein